MRHTLNTKQIEVELGTKPNLKNEAVVDTSDFAKKADLADLESDIDKLDIKKLKTLQNDLKNLKSKVERLDIGELETTIVDLGLLTDLVKNKFVKKLNMTNQLKKLTLIRLLTLMIQLKTDYYTKTKETIKKVTDNDHD